VRYIFWDLLPEIERWREPEELRTQGLAGRRVGSHQKLLYDAALQGR
jgi:hypothetical protein